MMKLAIDTYQIAQYELQIARLQSAFPQMKFQIYVEPQENDSKACPYLVVDLNFHPSTHTSRTLTLWGGTENDSAFTWWIVPRWKADDGHTDPVVLIRQYYTKSAFQVLQQIGVLVVELEEIYEED